MKNFLDLVQYNIFPCIQAFWVVQITFRLGYEDILKNKHPKYEHKLDKHQEPFVPGNRNIKLYLEVTFHNQLYVTYCIVDTAYCKKVLDIQQAPNAKICQETDKLS